MWLPCEPRISSDSSIDLGARRAVAPIVVTGLCVSLRHPTTTRALHPAYAVVKWATIAAVVIMSSCHISEAIADGSSHATTTTVEGWNKRGLAPQSISEFEKQRLVLLDDDASPVFRCFLGTPAWVPASSINDDFCDCEDGSDEPGTSACSSRGQINGVAIETFRESLKPLHSNVDEVGGSTAIKFRRPSFYCANLGFKDLLVPHSRVDDGVCDCCDGSDEAGVGTDCPPTCSILGAQLREELIVRRKTIEAATTKLRSMSNKGSRVRRNFVQEVEKLRFSVIPSGEERLRQLEAKEQQLRAEAETKSQKDQEFAAGYQDSSLDRESSEETTQDGKLTTPTRPSSQKNERVVKSGAAKEDSSTVSEYSAWMDQETLRTRELEPQVGVETKFDDGLSMEQSIDEDSSAEPGDVISDEIVTRVSNQRTSTTLPEWNRKSMDDEDQIEQHAAFMTQFFRRLLNGLTYVHAITRTWYRRMLASKNNEILTLSEIRQKIWTANSELTERREELARMEGLLAALQGVPDALVALAGECYSTPQLGSYIYEVCFFKEATQREVRKSFYRLGSFEFVRAVDQLPTMEEVVASDQIPTFLVRFGNGNNCQTSLPRSLTVSLVCGSENEFIVATESDRCEFSGVFKSPSACLFA